jgi:predicted DNA-binding transcriptional regulator AlpA
MDEIEAFLPRKQVLKRYGISAMGLWRWERDPAVAFPTPIEISGRFYYPINKLRAWELQRATQAPSRRSKALVATVV